MTCPIAYVRVIEPLMKVVARDELLLLGLQLLQLRVQLLLQSSNLILVRCHALDPCLEFVRARLILANLFPYLVHERCHHLRVHRLLFHVLVHACWRRWRLIILGITSALNQRLKNQLIGTLC